MKWLILLVMLIALLAGACVRSPQVSNVNSAPETPRPSPTEQVVAATTTAPALPPFKDGVVLNITVESDPGRKPRISGETNLPEGTELSIGIEGKTSNFSGGDKAIVSGGRFRSVPFGPEGGLKPGQYVASVLTPIPQVQPAKVREAMGANGENLRGPLVKRGSIGPTVEVEQAFQLDESGNIKSGTDKAQVAAATGEVREVYKALLALEQQGRGMETLRRGYPNDLEKVRQCGDFMRERQPQAKSLRERAEGLPKPYSMHLAAAATELVLCVSCSRSALDNCDRARSSLKDAEKEINRR
jgi:hypothetical protein